MLVFYLLDTNIFSNISAYSQQVLILFSLLFIIPAIWIVTSCLYYQIKKNWLYLIILALVLPLGLIIFSFPYLKAVRQDWANRKVSSSPPNPKGSILQSLFFKIISILSGLIVLFISSAYAAINIMFPPGWSLGVSKDTDILIPLLIVVCIGVLIGSLLVYSRPHSLDNYVSSNSPVSTITYRRRLSTKKALYILGALILPNIIIPSLFVPLFSDPSFQVSIVVAGGVISLIGLIVVFIKVK